MPRPTREQILTDLQGLSPEQQRQYMDEVERRWPPAEKIPETPTTPSEPGQAEYEQALSDVRSFRDVGTGALQSLYNMIAGGGQVIRDIVPDVVPGFGPVTPEQKAVRAKVREWLAPQDSELTGAHSTGRLLGSVVPIVAAPGSLAVQAPLGAATSGAETLGETGDYGKAAESAAFSAAMPIAFRQLASISKPLRDWAIRNYAKILAPVGSHPAKIGSISKKIEPVAEDLPVGFRGHILSQSEKAAEKAGATQRATYEAAGETPASFKPVEKKLRASAETQVRTPGRVIEGPEGLPMSVPSDIRYPKLHQQLLKEAERAGTAQETAETLGRKINVKELYETRKSLFDQIEAAKKKAYQPGAPSKGEAPKIRAMKEHAAGVSEELHGLVPEGAEVDRLFHAWKTTAEGAGKTDPGNFITRFFLARTLGGQLGTLAGTVAAKPAFWRSIMAKSGIRLSQALQAGNKAQFVRILQEAAKAAQSEEQPNAQE